MAQKYVLQLNEKDNVAIAMANIDDGTVLSPFEIDAIEPVPRGHKLALRSIPAGEAIVKYGQIIGVASKAIAPGAHVHTQNVSMSNFDRNYAFGQHAKQTEMVSENERATFAGYRRVNGKVGTRNYVGMLTRRAATASPPKAGPTPSSTAPATAWASTSTSSHGCGPARRSR